MSGRYRFVLVEERACAPIRWRPAPHRPAPSFDAARALLAAALRSSIRGAGPAPWVPGHRGDPIAFLMEAVEHPVRLWSAAGAPLYQNTAAHRAGELSHIGLLPAEVTGVELPGGHRMYRRSILFHNSHDAFVLEVFTPAPGA